jgi:hypothetical protein
MRALNCIEYGLELQVNSGHFSSISIVDSLAFCHAACVAEPHCARFSYYKSGSCVLADSYAIPRAHSYSVASGALECDEHRGANDMRAHRWSDMPAAYFDATMRATMPRLPVVFIAADIANGLGPDPATEDSSGSGSGRSMKKSCSAERVMGVVGRYNWDPGSSQQVPVFILFLSYALAQSCYCLLACLMAGLLAGLLAHVSSLPCHTRHHPPNI